MTSLASGYRPFRLSALYHKQLSLGANFLRDEWGWMRAQWFKQPEDEKKQAEQNVALADVSHLSKLGLQGQDMVKVLTDTYQSPSPVKQGMVLTAGSGVLRDTLCCVLARDDGIILMNPNSMEAVARKIKAEPSTCVHITDMSSTLAGLYLIGPKGTEVISKLTELNLAPQHFPDLRVAQAPLLHVRSAVLRLDLKGLLAYQLYFERAYGDYLWDAIMHAGEELHIAPIGVSTLKLLGSRWN